MRKGALFALAGFAARFTRQRWTDPWGSQIFDGFATTLRVQRAAFSPVISFPPGMILTPRAPMADHPYPVRPMSQPFLMRNRSLLLGAIMTLGFTLWLVTQPLWPIVLLLPFTAFRSRYLSSLVRCPECRSRLRTRELSLPTDPHRNPKIYYDCPFCSMTWDPHIFDEMAD